jgi:uncharacterized protein (TIGR02118 family)
VSAPDDKPQRFIRALGLATRKAGMTQEAFETHWRDVHAELARHYPNVVRYSLLPVRERHTPADLAAVPAWGENVHGIVDFIFTSKEEIDEIWNSPEGIRGLADDPNFLESVVLLHVEEISVTDHLGIGKMTDRPLTSQPLRLDPEKDAYARASVTATPRPAKKRSNSDRASQTPLAFSERSPAGSWKQTLAPSSEHS